MVSVPVGSELVVTLTVPVALTVPEPMVVPPLEMVMVPVAPVGTLAVMVTGEP